MLGFCPLPKKNIFVSFSVPIYYFCVNSFKKSMGAIAVSIFVSVIAIVGVIYFNHQDKKGSKNNK